MSFRKQNICKTEIPQQDMKTDYSQNLISFLMNHEVFKTESARSSSNKCETFERVGEIKLMMKFSLCLHNFSEL